ncbi:Expansin-like B1 [Bienertia sinuspersici]
MQLVDSELTLNGGDVSATSRLYRGGIGQGSGDKIDFILSEHAFSKMAQTEDAAATLKSLEGKLQYARVKVELAMDLEFPDCVTFYNEKGCQVQAPIGYEWKPTQCAKCKKYGHHEIACYTQMDVPRTKKIWKAKGQEQVSDHQGIHPH